VKVAIVGAGAAGASAALALAEAGVGAEVSLFGGEPFVPYERPALSKEFLTAEVCPSEPPLSEASVLAQHGVRLEIDSRVVAVDPAARALTLAGGRHVEYERLLLATGAEPRRLELPGSELAGIFYLRDFADARRLRPAVRRARRVAIVGGGVIGLEVAASACAIGCEVTVIEAAPHVMARIVPPGLADEIADLHRARGVEVRTGVRPIAFASGDGRVRGVELADGGVVAADTVVVGIGAIPRTELAESAGLAVDDGVVVDEYFRSSDEHIFAAGDLARVFHAGEQRHVRVEQWQTAQEQGRHAAMSMLGRAEPYRDVPWMWSDQHDAHIQTAGFDFGEAEIVHRGTLSERTGTSFLAVRNGLLRSAGGVSLGTGIARTVRPAQMLIARDARLDAEQLADPDLDLRRLAKELARQDDQPTRGGGSA
jgi:3-phenylpropionate/trans-cinnamate dioxygenase ferredoxin reductase component